MESDASIDCEFQKKRLRGMMLGTARRLYKGGLPLEKVEEIICAMALDVAAQLKDQAKPGFLSHF